MALPDVATMAEQGFNGHEADTMTGMLLPAGMPQAFTAQVRDEVARWGKVIRDAKIETN